MVCSALAAVVLLLAALAPVGAQGEEVTKSFRLTLDGDVPRGAVFVAYYDFLPERGGSSPGPVDLCGGNGAVECTGGGTVYTGPRRLPAGSTIEYSFVRRQENDISVEETFVTGTEDLDGNVTNAATYTFTAADGQQGGGQPDDQQQSGEAQTGDQEQQAPGLPNTGGGAGRTRSLRDTALVGLVLVMAGAFVGRRRYPSASRSTNER